MFYNNFDNVHGEDRYGMVGKTGDPFREECKLGISCYQLLDSSMVGLSQWLILLRLVQGEMVVMSLICCILPITWEW